MNVVFSNPFKKVPLLSAFVTTLGISSLSYVKLSPCKAYTLADLGGWFRLYAIIVGVNLATKGPSSQKSRI
jgi:hypothetical protein